MNSQHSQNRTLVVAFAATALALIAAAPAGAWADAPGGRQDGKGIGSIPPPEIQTLHQRSATIASNVRHEGVLAERRVGSTARTAVVVGAMNPGVVVRNGRTFVPGVSATGASTLIEIRPRGVSVVPAVSAASGDDGFEWSPAAIGLTAALAVALLMAVATAGVAGGRRRRVATL